LFADDPAGQTNGAIAQLGERYNGIVEVSGSIPLSSTKLFNNLVKIGGDAPLFIFVNPSISPSNWLAENAIYDSLAAMPCASSVNFWLVKKVASFASGNIFRQLKRELTTPIAKPNNMNPQR
jgi:hypothetical protein